MVKIARLNDAFLEVFQPQAEPSRRSMTAAKRNEKEKKDRPKKIPKIEKPKDIDHFLVQKLSQNFDFCACPSQNVPNHYAEWQERQAVVIQVNL